jgi:hypothetical protein
MKHTLVGLAAFAALAAGTSAAALAQTCPPGHVLRADGLCYAAATPGGVVGGAANAAGNVVSGTLGAAGAIAGGAVNTAGSIVGGTVGAATGTLAPPPPPPPVAYGSSTPPAEIVACPPGYTLWAGGCYPAR